MGELRVFFSQTITIRIVLLWLLVECTVACSRSQFSWCSACLCVLTKWGKIVYWLCKSHSQARRGSYRARARDRARARALLLLLLLCCGAAALPCVCAFRAVLGNARAKLQRQRQQQRLHTTGKWQCLPTTAEPQLAEREREHSETKRAKERVRGWELRERA